MVDELPVLQVPKLMISCGCKDILTGQALPVRATSRIEDPVREHYIATLRLNGLYTCAEPNLHEMDKERVVPRQWDALVLTPSHTTL